MSFDTIITSSVCGCQLAIIFIVGFINSSSHRKCSTKIAVLKNSAIVTGKKVGTSDLQLYEKETLVFGEN